MARLYQPLAPDIRTVDEIQAHQDRADLAAAVAWGYRPDEPGTLDQALAALNSASVAPGDPYADRSDGGAALRRQEARYLVARLVGIRERGAHRAGGASC
jgi:hypothetical protein